MTRNNIISILCKIAPYGLRVDTTVSTARALCLVSTYWIVRSKLRWQHVNWIDIFFTLINVSLA